jgi:hypothetical protein
MFAYLGFMGVIRERISSVSGELIDKLSAQTVTMNSC